MPAPKGFMPANAGKGRPKGSMNKDHAKVKAAIAKLAEDNVENMQVWLEDVARENKLEALKFMLNLMEYNIPKLARTDNTTQLTGDIPAIQVQFVNSKLNDNGSVPDQG